MKTDITTNVALTVKPKVGVGPTTIGGTLFAIVAAVGAIYAGVAGNDVATATGGFTSLLAAISVLGGRYAQAVAQIRAVAPTIEQVAHATAEVDPEA